MAKKSAKKPAKKTAAKKPAVKTAPAKPGAKITAKEAAASLKWVHDFTMKMIDDVPADKLTFQAEGAKNHALWTLGHLATGYQWFGPFIGAKKPELPASYDKLFGYGSKPTTDPSAYPPIAEVRKHHLACFRAVMDAANKLDDASLSNPPSGEATMVTSMIDGLIKTAWHEGWHQGQLAAWRSAAGLKPAM